MSDHLLINEYPYNTLIELADVEDAGKKLNVTLEIHENGLLICPEGYGNLSSARGHGCPVLFEVANGRLRVIVWDDINTEEPSHVIDLEGAREIHYRETEDDAE